MITPRRTRLARAADLHAFRRALAVLSPGAVVIVPTRGAARQLRRSAATAAAVTRDGLYDCLRARLRDAPRRLSAFERDVLMQAAARAATKKRVRPGLVVEILRFYDLLRRHSQQVDRFEALIEQELQPHVELDTGAERMLDQTRFLASSFREYERRIRTCDADDEHTLRDRLLAEPSTNPVRHVIAAVPDWIADPDGLYVADFDLLARIPGLEALDIICTEGTLGSGFYQRLQTWLPGIEEMHGTEFGATPPARRPSLAVPADPADALWFTCRDREEELVDVASEIKSECRIDDRAALERIAVVFKRPLPYLYLAADTLGSAAIPYQILDALPLATEPTAAAFDLAIEFVASGYTRSAIVALLRSPHFSFGTNGRELTQPEVSALDRALSEGRYLGELARLEELAGSSSRRDCSAALDIALAAAREVSPLAELRPASEQIRRLVRFFESHARPIEDNDLCASRERRARAAVIDSLVALANAHAAYDDPKWTIVDLGVAVRRWIEEETFVPESLDSGVQLLDDQAARFGDFDDLTIVGLVEGDWPEAPRRNIFYPSRLLKSLGWPSEKDRRAAAEARFLDLLASPSRRVAISTVTLDDEVLVEPSSLLDEIPRVQLSRVVRASKRDAPASIEDALAADPVRFDMLGAEAQQWAALRGGRSGADAPGYHGQAGPQRSRSWSVSALETYLTCPFKFFAQHVLALEEEPDDEEVMDPRAQGRFVHEVFETFFRDWQAAGRRSITPDNLDDARETFACVVERLVQTLPPAEGGLERTRLLGSSASTGLGEAVLRMEAERPAAVLERLLEYRLEGDFTLDVDGTTRRVALRGKADRLDLLEDGTFRLIDYKLGWPPQRARALQLPIYSLCAEQKLSGRRGQQWRVGEAVYLAFKGPRRVVPLFTSDAERADVFRSAQERLAQTLDAISRGEFPPRPDDVYRCETCSFAAVCRKDYVGDV